jgi:hypothetical protein
LLGTAPRLEQRSRGASGEFALGGNVAIALRGSLKQASQQLGISLNTHELVPLGIVLGVAFVLRLFLSQILGLAGDLTSYVNWGDSLPHTLLNFYTLHRDDNYPPFINLFFAVFDRFYTFGSRALGVHNPSLNLTASRPAAVFFRLPFVLSDIATSAVLYVVVRRVTTAR